MYEELTDRARKVMAIANQEAQRFNHEYLGCEHLLLGIIREGNGVALTALKNLDINLHKLALDVEEIMKFGPEMVLMGKMPQTKKCKETIEYAIEESKNLGHNYIGTEHLLLGLLRSEDSIPAQVLSNHGASIVNMRRIVLEILGVRPENSYSSKDLHSMLDKAIKLSSNSGLDITAAFVQIVHLERTESPSTKKKQPGVGKSQRISS